MRFIFRLLAVGSLVLAVMAIVIDATRLIATGEWAYAPIGQSWRENMPELLAFIWGAVDYDRLKPFWDMMVATILSLPAWLVLGVLALGFYALGRRRNRRGGRAAV